MGKLSESDPFDLFLFFFFFDQKDVDIQNGVVHVLSQDGTEATSFEARKLIVYKLCE